MSTQLIEIKIKNMYRTQKTVRHISGLGKETAISLVVRWSIPFLRLENYFGEILMSNKVFNISNSLLCSEEWAWTSYNVFCSDKYDDPAIRSYI